MGRRKKSQRGQKEESKAVDSDTWFKRTLKWVGGVTAILSLIFGLQQMTKMISNYFEQRSQVAEMLELGKSQQSAYHYPEAWTSFEKANQLDEDDRNVGEAQEMLAIEWLNNIRVTEGEETFTDIVDRLLYALHRGVLRASGSQKADLIAYLGWADFLRWRDGNRGLKPEEHYRHALTVDSQNVYAHTMWGHWILWNGGRLEDARRHFAAAIASGRERDYVRKMQFSALLNVNSKEAETEIIRVTNEMRKNNEQIEPKDRRRIFWIYSQFSSRIMTADLATGKFTTVVPPVEELSTFRWLFYDFDLEVSHVKREYLLASLLEAAGQRTVALQAFDSLRSRLPVNSRLRAKTDAAIERLSKGL